MKPETRLLLAQVPNEKIDFHLIDFVLFCGFTSDPSKPLKSRSKVTNPCRLCTDFQIISLSGAQQAMCHAAKYSQFGRATKCVCKWD